tara:strand:- start:375 stop:605 length:231 start_codon:yes stop_codon:yes gene_type:complete
MAVVVKRTGKLEKEIMIGGIVAIVGYFVWKRFSSPKVLSGKLEAKKEDCSVGSFNQREMCKERNYPGYIHAPLQAG